MYPFTGHMTKWVHVRKSQHFDKKNKFKTPQDNDDRDSFKIKVIQSSNGVKRPFREISGSDAGDVLSILMIA